jgi:hypothetical protein
MELIARQRPQGLNQTQIDEFFIETVCQLNDDKEFWAGMAISGMLNEYLLRYVIMYFDYEFPHSSPFQNYLHDFVNRHRSYLPPKKLRLNREEASRLFEISWDRLKQMDLKSFNRLYRKMALKHHPDQGGSQEKFVKLANFYKSILRKKKR